MTTAKEKTNVIHSTFTIERVYPATPEKVFAAFADPAKKRRWFAEGDGFEVDAFEMDFRVGGREHGRFRIADNGPMHGTPITNDTTYLDIVPNQRIITAYTMSLREKRISASMATTELMPGKEPNSTTLIFTEQGAYLEGADGPKTREAGTRELLEALARELAQNA